MQKKNYIKTKLYRQKKTSQKNRRTRFICNKIKRNNNNIAKKILFKYDNEFKIFLTQYKNFDIFS